LFLFAKMLQGRMVRDVMTDDLFQARINQAVLDFTLGEEDKAELALLEILQEATDNSDAFRALAEVRLAKGDLDGAESACRSALRINEGDLTSTVSLARILVAKGDKDGAEKASADARILGWKDDLAQDEESA
jgi:predicted Zn-dependent protease